MSPPGEPSRPEGQLAALPALLVSVREARRELHVARCEAMPAPARVAQQQLASALAAYVEALTSLGLPVPYAIRDEARIQDRIAGPNTSVSRRR